MSSGISGAMNTALSGLLGFESGITTVSENLTNATVPGYGVETVSLSTAQDTPGQAGNGVQQPVITRAADGFAAGLLRTANSAAQAATVQSSALTGISNALQNNGDIQSSMNQFFNDISGLSANPTNSGAQQTVLSDANTIAGTFQSAASSLSGAISSANVGLQQNITAANSLLSQLSVINKGLQSAPNDPSLLDQQQSALNSLSQQLPVNVLTQPNGEVYVYSGGTALLNQGGAQTLTATLAANASTPTLTAGNVLVPLTLGETDGAIGANLSATQSGALALQSLGALAVIFAATVNTSQAQGLTPTGQPGGALIAVPAPTVGPSATNTGTATISAVLSNAQQLPVSGGPFLLSFSSSTGWSATDQATGTPYPVTTGTSGGPPPATTLAFAGMTATINAGTPASGDSFVVNPAPSAAANFAVAATDPNQIAAADPFVATPGTPQSNGGVINNNAGNVIIGNDSVISGAAAATAQTNGAALVPASFWNTNSYGSTSLQMVFTSATAYNLETTGSTPTVISTGTFNGVGDIAVAYPSTGAAAGQYWQLSLSGTPAAGDVIAISPGGSSSGSNAARMSALWTNPATSSQGSLQQAVVGFSTSLGANAQHAQQLATSTAAQVTSTTSNLQTISGVNSDQQAVLLTNYQQAYQAAAQAISTAHSMFESLIQAI